MNKTVNMDVIFGRLPVNEESVKYLQQRFCGGSILRPLYDKELVHEQKVSGLRGPLYSFIDTEGAPVTGEELSWAMTRGYVRSHLHGPTESLESFTGDEIYVFSKPEVEYYVTEKGRTTRVWY